MINIAILASGSGSNAESIMKHFSNNNRIKVRLVISNNSNAGVIARALKYGVETKVINSKKMMSGELLEQLLEYKIDFIVLAGFMKLIPIEVIKEYKGRIVNIHPALLPKFGGKGMYGMNVHKAVVLAGEKETGMTIHYVNEKYDEGKIIFQDRVSVSGEMNAEVVAAKVLELEHKHYPRIIQQEIERIF